MATLASSATCQLSEDKTVALPRCADGEYAFAYGADVLRGGFHRWTVTLSREPADADGGPAPAGDAPLGFGVCVGVVAEGAPARRLPPEQRVVPTACTAGRGVYFERSSEFALGAPRFGALPSGTPDLTAVWDGKLTQEAAIEAAAVASDPTLADAGDDSLLAADADAAPASPAPHASSQADRRRRSESGNRSRSGPATPATPSSRAPLPADAAAAAVAWGYNPHTHAVYASGDARKWGWPLVVLPQSLDAGMTGAGSLQLTICVDLGARP